MRPFLMALVAKEGLRSSEGHKERRRGLLQGAPKATQVSVSKVEVAKKDNHVGGLLLFRSLVSQFLGQSFLSAFQKCRAARFCQRGRHAFWGVSVWGNGHDWQYFHIPILQGKIRILRVNTEGNFWVFCLGFRIHGNSSIGSKAQRNGQEFG